MLEFVRRMAIDKKDFRMAHHAKELRDSLTAREEARRLHRISERHDTEQTGVQEAHMMQVLRSPCPGRCRCERCARRVPCQA